MSQLTSPLALTDQDTRTTANTQGGANLGQMVLTSDGKTFVYAVNTSTTLTLIAGKLTQGAVATANHLNRTGVTTVAGQKQVTFAVGATLVSSNQYAQGYLVVNKGTGAGQALEVAGNTSAASSGSPTINLEDAVITATAVADSKFSLYPNPFSACLIYAHASPNTSIPTGVPNVTVPVATTANPGTYYWSQVGGECSVLADAATWVGTFDGVIASTLTDGAVGIQATATIQPTLGYSLDTLVSTEYRPVMLTGMPA